MQFYSIGGFFGSGKTTLLLLLAKHLSQVRGERVAVIQNEIGEVGVDDLVSRNAGLNTEEILGGCVCCELRNGLVVTLQRVAREVKPDSIVLEASGMAMPDALAMVLDDTGLEFDRIWKTVVLDAARLSRVEDCLKVPYVERAVESADAVVYNKIDRVEAERVERFVREARERRDDLVVEPAQLNAMSTLPAGWEVLFDGVPRERKPEVGSRHGDGHEHDHAHPAVVVKQWRRGDLTATDPETVAAWVADLGAQVSGPAGALIGHIKVYAEYATGGQCLVRLTDADEGPSREAGGDCNGPIERLTVNAIVFGISEGVLQKAVVEAFRVR